MGSALNFIALILFGVHYIVHFDSVRAASMFPGSDHEDIALAELHELVDPFAYREFMKSDGYLLRWLKETDFDVEKAFEKFSKFLEWRRLHKVDSVVFEDFSAVAKDLPYSLDTFDKDGRPVMWSPLASYDHRKFVIAGAEDVYLRYWVQMHEIIEVYLHELKTTNPNVTQAIAIFDMAGFNLKTVGCYRCINMIPQRAANAELNYPFIFHKAYLINAPKMFHNGMTLINKALSAKAREVMFVFGHEKSEWVPILQEQIPMDQLPVEYGGTMPSFRFKTVKEAQRTATEALLVKAKNAAQRDLKNLTGTGNVPNDLAKFDQASQMEVETEEEHEHDQEEHHHHYLNSVSPSPAPSVDYDCPDHLHNETSALEEGRASSAGIKSHHLLLPISCLYLLIFLCCVITSK